MEEQEILGRSRRNREEKGNFLPYVNHLPIHTYIHTYIRACNRNDFFLSFICSFVRRRLGRVGDVVERLVEGPRGDGLIYLVHSVKDRALAKGSGLRTVDGVVWREV